MRTHEHRLLSLEEDAPAMVAEDHYLMSLHESTWMVAEKVVEATNA